MRDCHEKCDHQHGAHDQMRTCNSSCRCFFYMQKQAAAAWALLEDISDDIHAMRFAWPRTDSRHEAVVGLAERIREFTEYKP